MTDTFVAVIMSEPLADDRPDQATRHQTGSGSTRGWCPGVLDPMDTGDGWLLRIRIPGGLVTPRQLGAVATIAAQYGSGMVDITSRGNLQIRGVAAEAIDPAAQAVVHAGLSRADARSDAFRAVVSSPLTGHDPVALCDTQSLVTTLVDRLATSITGTLPSKFGVVLDDGGTWPLDAIDADINLRADGAGRWTVRVRGAIQPIGWTDNPADTVLAATQLCVDNGRRMDGVIATIGRAIVADRLAIALGSALPEPSAAAQTTKDRIIGRLPHPDAGRSNIIAAPFLGRVTTDVLGALADLASSHAEAVRLTPDHSMAFCGVAESAAAMLLANLTNLDLVIDPHDPRSALSACVGSLGCARAHADTWAFASQMAATVTRPNRVHLSACAKGCGAPSGVSQLVADESGMFR